MKTKTKIFSPFLILMGVTILLPMMAMLMTSFHLDGDGQFTLANYTTIFTQAYYRQAIFNSLGISVVAALIGLIIAVLGAWAITRLSAKAQAAALTLFNIATSFAGIPLAFSLIILFGNDGVLNAVMAGLGSAVHSPSIYSLGGLILAYVFFEVPLGILFLYPPFREISRDWQEASLMLGASRRFYLTHIVLPIVLPNLIETFIILFANAMGTYETMYALTGNNIATIPIIIGSLINGSLNANIPLASALSTVFVLSIVVLVTIGNWLTKRKRTLQTVAVATKRPARNRHRLLGGYPILMRGMKSK
ncbi:ABC transporter permease [Furfurilactobacillus rossiae]|uniref:ABC superfamily ATP binding cassette transporter, permease protein n=1 Tax=Furfurilactobacillus rossiae DSM 15814 TaxID=1114972 RepID=A0A0R1RI64_9LACO|nr:ABC transporter permease subunit [Furfurilactobacillus rossiae]KRL54474.1 ABC superfamily ATP binding cassette transporter, permease protein [Furfurilactobacillus rossiae DSM 15814]QFR67409.1 ABC transporter permease subunit [Furfurilactobacillus rossiae]QLE60350.1 ABC transporter permease subunit [Furfurilactobacillus rossiae]